MSSSKLRLLTLSVIVLLVSAAWAGPQQRIAVDVSYFTGGLEQTPFGPSVLKIAPDGSFWIVNPADNTLTNVSPEGSMLRQIDLAAAAVGVTDILFSEDGALTVLDGAAGEREAIVLAPDGTIRARQKLHERMDRLHAPSMNGVDAETPAAAGELSDEWTGQATFDRWRIGPGTDGQPNAVLTAGGDRIEIEASAGVIRGVRILADRADGVFVLAEEVMDGDPIAVDATVRRYSHSGQLLGIGRIPLSGQFAYVDMPVAIDADGAVYLLTTLPGRAVIEPLELTGRIEPILPERRDPRHALEAQAAPAVSDLAVTPAITRAQMEANARAFLYNSVYYPQDALTGACAGRVAPRHLGTTPRTIGSVAYDWGGWDSISAYNSAIASGRRAGDIATATQESCSRGVDCSGYVTRVWGLSDYKRSTCSLSEVSTVISTGSLKKGDILTKCGDHVVMFESVASNGINDYESTVYNGLDRVVYLNSSWSRLNGYTARRYVNVIEEAPAASTPSHIGSSSSPASLSPGGVATFVSTWRNTDGTPMTAKLTLRAPDGSTYNFVMTYVSGQTTTGANFQTPLYLHAAGRYDYAITVSSTTTGRSARYPSSGYISGPAVVSVRYSVSPWYPVCGQYPITVRVSGELAYGSTVRFRVTKGNAYCNLNGNFLANGVVDLRLDGPYGTIVASRSYSAGAPEVVLDVPMTFASGYRRYYATIRNQGYWAGPVTVSAY